MKILLIEDDRNMTCIIKHSLKNYYLIETAKNGQDGKLEAQSNMHDLIILDYLLPDISGPDICRQLRKEGITIPILILTGQYELDKKIKAFEAGADDYLTKPFSFAELTARIRALSRRYAGISPSAFLKVGDLTLDRDHQIVKRKTKEIFLRRKELYLLEYMMQNAGRVMTREMILDHVWNSMSDVAINVVDVHIKYLRDKIDKEFPKKLIKTIHGVGYKIDAK